MSEFDFFIWQASNNFGLHQTLFHCHLENEIKGSIDNLVLKRLFPELHYETISDRYQINASGQQQHLRITKT
jgi:hypothetical protein